MKSLLRETHIFDAIDTQTKQQMFISGADRSYRIALAYHLHEETSGSVFFVCRNDYEAKQYYDELRRIISDSDVLFFPKEPLYFTFADSFSRGISIHRLKVMRAAIDQQKKIIVTSIWALAEQRIFATTEHIKTYHSSDELDMQDLIRLLVDYGYEREERTESPGQFSVRGGIIDYYDATQQVPIRIEFWGNEIDSVRTYDPDTQLSIEKQNSFSVFPFSDIMLTEEEIISSIDKMEQQSKKTIASISDIQLNETMTTHSRELFSKMRENPYEASHLVYAYSGKNLQGVLSIFGQIPIILADPNNLKQGYDLIKKTVADDFVSFSESGLAYAKQLEIFTPFEELMQTIQAYPFYALSTIHTSNSYLPAKQQHDAACADVIDYKGNIRIFLKQLTHYIQSDYRIVLTYENEKQLQHLHAILEGYDLNESDELSPGNIVLKQSPALAGMDFAKDRLLIVPYRSIAPKEKKETKKKRTKSEREAFFSDIKPGDYVVHETHGIGRYDGIHQIEVAGISKDYIKVLYAKEDTLYVPADQMDLVQKYIGAKETPPKLHRLGSTDWTNAKKKVSHAVKELAEEYIKMYARRRNQIGYAFGPDTAWQKEFEDRFPYEPTEDQLRCTTEIKADMERPTPMDRLLCGDVGYGKTEVAQRAAFKAVMDGKQVAVLVPTTILALQHFNNFTQRFAGYPIKIEMMCRLRSTKENNKTAEHARTGRADIIIGTHRILSKDVAFKDLGLLIVDEEQRFGVAHKDKLKLLKNNVDTLTLSATPIPRTLHMSLTGIRDMSVIETPPVNRLEVQTYVMEYEEIVIREALKNELARGGQIFYVYNRVQDIAERAHKISELVPEANVTFAHGQMKETELERIILAFLNREYDILVSTTIIENGVDIINANTMIVENADHMGLSQLYQLRGRVGRGDVAAYAYMTYRKDKILSEIATKRLQSIKEFTKFGSGFKIAMRDLQVRGAGNLLGANQHGHFHNVGYEMYCRLLSEAVMEERGERPKQKRETEIDLNISAYLPESYIPSEQQRIELYKTIASIETKEDKDSVTEEIVDIYSDPPDVVENLLAISLLKAHAQTIGIRKIKQSGTDFVIEYHTEMPPEPNTIQILAKTYRIKAKQNVALPTLVLSMKQDSEPIAFLDQFIKNHI